MQYFARPIQLTAAATLLAAAAVLTPPPACAQEQTLRQLLDRLHMSSHSGAPGYLGVYVGDVDNESFARLRLVDKRGAVVTIIDHDAPAGGQKGLRVNDVVLSINGQNVDNAAQFNTDLHELAPGRWVSLVIYREGNQETISLQLVDRRTMERDVWNKLNARDDSGSGGSGGLHIVGASSGDAPSTGFHLPFFGSELKVGAVVEPLPAQMFTYLGISGGIFVKQVTRHSEAEACGLKESDVILRVGTEAINTPADWDRNLKANQNKQVQLVILRDRRQQTLTMQVDNKHPR